MTLNHCSKCADLRVQYRIRHPGDLRQAISVIRAEIEAGVLTEATLSNPEQENWRTEFSQLLSGAPDDLVLCYFRCTNCSQLFRLSCETYHGSGGSWAPVDSGA